MIKKYIRNMIDYLKLESDIKKCVGGGQILPVAVEIETINRCNGKCEFCPVNINQPQRPYVKMSIELFENIIGQLKAMRFSGKVALFSNNEPFLDSGIIEKMRYARMELPNACIYIYTNGSIMSIEQLKEASQLLNYIIIDNYNDGENVKQLENYCNEHSEEMKNVVFSKVDEKAIRTNRGGQAPNKVKRIKTIKSKCILPFTQFIIRPDGKVSLCCNDALGIWTMGDLNCQTILEIWNGEAFGRVRDEMKKTGRKGLRLCEGCDVVNTTNCSWKFRHWF